MIFLIVMSSQLPVSGDPDYASKMTLALSCGNRYRCDSGAWYDAYIMDDNIHPKQLEGFRGMTPAQKLRMVADLYEAGIQLRVAGLRLAHPDWPPERLDRHARESLRHAGT